MFPYISLSSYQTYIFNTRPKQSVSTPFQWQSQPTQIFPFQHQYCNMFVEFPSIEFILIESKTSSVESWKRMSQVPQPNSSSSQLGMLTSSEPQISGPVHQPLSMSAIISLSVNRQETASAHMLIVAQAMLISPPPQIIRRCKHRWPQTGPVRS